MPKTVYTLFFKRLIDVIVSFVGLVILSPLLLLLSGLVFVKLGRPIFFYQERPGKHEKIFKLIKFRSMKNTKATNGEVLSDEMRLTSFGKRLRSTSLDELPSLWNVLKGDMSLVGPRPLLVDYLPLYDEKQRQRHLVRPGITGLAQVKGRNAITWEEKFNWDQHYIHRLSFFQDFKILVLTAVTVLKKEGIHSENSVTQDPFRGNENDAISCKENSI